MKLYGTCNAACQVVWMVNGEEYTAGNPTRWVDENYCKKCKSIMSCYPGDTQEQEFAPCELDGCPYGVGVDEIDDTGLIKLWFEAEINYDNTKLF